MTLQDIDCTLQLIRNIQLVRIKKQNDQISSFRKPRDNLSEVVTPIDPLFLPRQDSWSINESDRTENTGWELRSLETTEKANAKALQSSKGQFGMNTQSVSWNSTFLGPVDEHCKTIRRRFGSDALTGKISTQKIANERSLSHRVLSNQKNLRFRIKFNVGQERAFIKVIILIALFNWKNSLSVDILEFGSNHVCPICRFLRRGT
mmetsp:Transcript_35496/g.52844  ORF Transcript_35496/g.52844 Transcript_35496/m.52844 type:complete len:205 (-) Transcript_35496:182-796(-)